MRALAFFAIAAAAGGTLCFLACSSDETPATSSSSSSGTTSGNTGSSGNSSGEGGSNVSVPDGGTLSSDGKCIIWCTPYQKAGKIESLKRADVTGKQNAWTNPGGGLQQDAELATVTLAEGEESEYLSVTGFDFSAITDERETWGIQVELTRQSDDGGAGDALIEVIIDGQQDRVRKKILENKKNPSGLASWPRLQIGTHHYGQALDTWGTNLNPADVRKPTFGARIAAKRLSGISSAPVTATVDSLKVSVCYCKAGDLSGKPPF